MVALVVDSLLRVSKKELVHKTATAKRLSLAKTPPQPALFGGDPDLGADCHKLRMFGDRWNYSNYSYDLSLSLSGHPCILASFHSFAHVPKQMSRCETRVVITR